MKKLIVAFLALVSFQSFAMDFNGFLLEPSEFDAAAQSLEQNMSIEEQTANYWQRSATSCYAYTRCPNGRTIHCRTYGYNYSNVPSHMSNSCSWLVYPGRAVRCQGYSVQTNVYGQSFWGYVDIPVSCY